YFLAAIQTIFPNALPETQTLLLVTPQPSITAIAHTLLNELNQIREAFILVLDDYHLIESQAIHNLVSELLTYPPHSLHLVLSTRMDPSLPLITLRAKNQMTEIRIPDLRFTQAETQQLFREMIGASVDLWDVDKMNAQAEGWVTGLRLAALALRHRIGANAIQGELSAQNRYVSDYLFNEILARQAATLSNCLLKTSILDRFCADLCERICFPDEKLADNKSEQSDFSGVSFLEWLQASNLFVIPLDDQRTWFRYHHLFQDFLQQQLTQRFEPDEIVELHTAAGRWFAQNDWIEEALHHFIVVGETTAALELIAQHRYRLMNETQWPRLERWTSLFPSQVVESSAELWMIKTWLVYQRGQWAELPGHLQHMADLLGQEADPETANRLGGEISALRSLVAYHQTDAAGAISQARKALEAVPPAFWIVRVFARLYLGAGLLMSGHENEGFSTLYGAFQEEKIKNKRFKATLLTVTGYLHWFTADLQGMAQAAQQAIPLCQESDHHQILRMANYHLGCVHYQQNDLATAEDLFASVTARPYQNYGTAYTNSVSGLGITYQAQGREAEAKQIIEKGIAFYLETGNTTQLPMIRALQAEIALRQGNLSVASQWADKLDPVPPFTPFWGFLTPHLTLVKVWLAQNTPASYEKASQLLVSLHTYLTETHNTRFLIDTLA
ncbi:MAG: hypothetical protein ACK2T5_07630, partial [Anaerolineales bacterium]